MNNIWIDFIKFCLDDNMPQPSTLSEADWDFMFDMMKKQALIGVMMRGMKKLKDVKIPRNIVLKVVGLNEKIQKNNQRLNEMAVRISSQFTDDGFECCILKGQGNALMYPDPLMRTPGDIDIWMKPKGMDVVRMDEVREQVTEYVKAHYMIGLIHYFHIEFHIDKQPVEAHFMPGIMNNPIYNRRLQRFYWDRHNIECAHWVELPDGKGAIPVPTLEFNIVFQLSHMMHHFFDEGIGLRQMMDYHYLLMRQTKKKDYEKELSYLGLRKFAGAVMYVLQEVFGLADSFLIVPVDSKRGRTLLNEIIKGGNFGQYSGLTKHGTASKFFLKSWRNLQLMTEFPAEALAEPIFRTYHFFWRKTNVKQ